MKCGQIGSIIVLVLFILFYPLRSYALEPETVINAAVEISNPPYQFLENGEIKGLHIDILNKIAEKNRWIINYIPKESLTDCFNLLEVSKVDLVLGGFSKEKNRPYVNYTNELSQSYICMLAPAEEAISINEEISNKRYLVAAQEGTTDYEYVRRMQNVEYFVVANQKRVFEALYTKRVDLAVGVKNSLIYQLEKENKQDDFMIINNFMGTIKYNIGVREGDVELLSDLNQTIRDIRLSGEYEDIYEKWIDENKYEREKLVRKILWITSCILLFVVIVIIINLRLNNLLKKQVAQKTSELRDANLNLQAQILETRNGAELNRKIIAHNPMGILVFDIKGEITLSNQSAQCYSKERDPIKGRPIFTIPFFKELLGDIKGQLGAEKDLWNNICMVKQENKEHYFRYSMNHLFQDDGKIRGMILLFDDITKELELRDKMYEAEKNHALNKIIAEIAHEIRNPLTAIKTLVELIPYKKDNAYFQEKLTQIVPQELDRVNGLIKTLIDYARPKDGIKTDLEINEILRNCIVLIKATSDESRINIEFCGIGPIYINAVENQIKQIFINLLLNAVEACTEKIKSFSVREVLCIKIRTELHGSSVVISFYDEGIGMTDEELKKCTEIFYTTKGTGSGTGLAICSQFTKENNGSLQFRSVKNQYTEARLCFPLAERERENERTNSDYR